MQVLKMVKDHVLSHADLRTRALVYDLVNECCLLSGAPSMLVFPRPHANKLFHLTADQDVMFYSILKPP